MKMSAKSKMAKGLKVPPKEKKKERKEKLTRGKRYTQFETDLLCDLVLASDINTMVTNKITTYGRMRGWEDIAKIFNASPNATQRTDAELRERCYNIKRDLKKLANHHLAIVLDTDGSAVSKNATKKCTVSFQLTKSVLLFSGTVQLTTTGLSSTDSDAPITYAMSVLEQMENAPKVNENAEDREDGKMQDSDSVEMSPLLPPVADANVVASASEDDAVASTSTSPARCDTPARRSQRGLFPNAQFFSTTQQRKRAKNRMEPNEADNISTTSTASNSTKRTKLSKTNSKNRDEYYSQKATLIADEIQRRAEWHQVCIALKQQELLVKQRQAEFWAKATSKLDQNMSIGDISKFASNLGTSTPPVQYVYEQLPPQPNIEIVAVKGEHVEFVDQ